ncbi:MFS transporter [Nonomuraea africana]|uniref:MFS family permease n=1 Tax=Nonomuraea africana TaxID=46171 RepID=A0ABR9KC10_9ACTN|nr:MFS transporter [Nonomuraea africana]MBE1559549.1 MFS family permease [Nonomuraea africana]
MARAAERGGRGSRGVVPLLAATGVSVTGDGAFLAAAPLLAATLTRDPLAVAAVTAAFSVPWLVIGLPAGALVDRWNRRRVMLAADLVRALVLTVAATLVIMGRASIPALVTAVLAVGAAQCFFDSAAQATIPAVAGRDKDALAHVNGRFWALDNVGRGLLGPPLGSATFALARALPFAIDAASFLVSAWLVRGLPDTGAAGAAREGLLSSVRAGLRHVFGTRDLRVLALSLGAYNCGFNLVLATFVLYATDVLAVPAAAYGLLMAAGAIGGVVAGWKARVLTRRLSYRQTTALALAVQALVWLGVLAGADVWTTGVLLAVGGAGATLTSVAVGSARHALTPDDLLGRVVAAFRLFGMGAAGLGALLGGVLARLFGLHVPFIAASGLVAVAAVLAWPRRSRA